jgi:hypothetical protein
MHPIERLRYVARASGAAQSALVSETARALASFSGDPQGLVTACRRIVSRQPTSGPLVWFAARVMSSNDPGQEIWESAGLIESDPTARELSFAFPQDATVVILGWPETTAGAIARRGDLEVLVVDAFNEGSSLVGHLVRADVDAVDVPLTGLGSAVAEADLVVIEASAIGPTDALCLAGSRPAAALARTASVPVWLVGGTGRLLPSRMWDGLVGQLDMSDPWDREDELVPLELVDRIVGVKGPEPIPDALRRTDCPVVPELFKGGVF